MDGILGCFQFIASTNSASLHTYTNVIADNKKQNYWVELASPFILLIPAVYKNSYFLDFCQHLLSALIFDNLIIEK